MKANIKKLFSLTIALVAMISFAQQVEARGELLLGTSSNMDGLTVQVPSGGCTAKEDFNLEVAETYPAQVTIVRTNMDFCEAYLPYGTTITFRWEELKNLAGDKFYLVNDIATGFESYSPEESFIPTKVIDIDE